MPHGVYLTKFLHNEYTLPCELGMSIIRSSCINSDELCFPECEICFHDGSGVELFANRSDDGHYFGEFGFSVGSGGYGVPLVNLIYDLASAYDLIILNDGGEIGSLTNPVAILLNEQQRQHLPDELRETAVVCPSAQTVGVALSAGFLRWHEYAYGNHRQTVTDEG